MRIEVGDSKVPVKIGETTHELTLGECLQLINGLRRVFPREMLIGQEIAAGKTEWSGPREGSPVPRGKMSPIGKVANTEWISADEIKASAIFHAAGEVAKEKGESE